MTELYLHCKKKALKYGEDRQQLTTFQLFHRYWYSETGCLLFYKRPDKVTQFHETLLGHTEVFSPFFWDHNSKQTIVPPSTCYS